MKNKRIKLVLILTMTLFFISIVISYLRLNSKYPQAKKIYYQAGEAGSFSEGIEATVIDSMWLKQKDFEGKYGKFKDAIDNSEYRMLLVSVRFRNINQDEQDVEIYKYYIECLGYCNGVGQDGFYTFNNIGIVFTLEPGEELDITIPYVFFDFQFNKTNWINLENKSFYLVNSWYPVKKIWYINTI